MTDRCRRDSPDAISFVPFGDGRVSQVRVVGGNRVRPSLKRTQAPKRPDSECSPEVELGSLFSLKQSPHSKVGKGCSAPALLQIEFDTFVVRHQKQAGAEQPFPTRKCPRGSNCASKSRTLSLNHPLHPHPSVFICGKNLPAASAGNWSCLTTFAGPTVFCPPVRAGALPRRLGRHLNSRAGVCPPTFLSKVPRVSHARGRRFGCHHVALRFTWCYRNAACSARFGAERDCAAGCGGHSARPFGCGGVPGWRLRHPLHPCQSVLICGKNPSRRASPADWEGREGCGASRVNA
jgi:hypothetical protein